MARVPTSKGEAVLRPMLGNDELILADLAENEDGGDASAYYKLKGRMVRALDAAAKECGWEGGFGALPASEILPVFVRWNVATDEEALPPDTGTDSETPSASGS